MYRTSIVVTSFVLALAACNGDGGMAAIDASTADATAGCAACNTVTLPAVVTKTADPAPRPAFTGGAIADGTYTVTSVVNYGTTTPGGTTVREIYKFSGNTVETAIASSESPETHYCGTFTTSGNMITYSLTCPMTGSISMAYTFSGNTFSFQHGSDQNEVAIATR